MRIANDLQVVESIAHFMPTERLVVYRNASRCEWLVPFAKDEEKRSCEVPAKDGRGLVYSRFWSRSELGGVGRLHCRWGFAGLL